jgi:hypothetical protein
MSSFYSTEDAVSRRRRQVVATTAATVIISGRNVAHRKRTPGQRALLAADILTGKVRLDRPTLKQTATLLHVSVPYVEAALRIAGDPALRARIEGGESLNSIAPISNGLATAWRNASAKERADLARVVGPDTIWAESIEPAIG